MEDKIQKLEAEAAQLKKLKAKFPDLTENRDRWGRVRLSAKSANALTTDIYTHHSCGCCNDAPFLARPYLKYEGAEIYSEPASVCIGEKSTSFYGDYWDDDWREKLSAIGIPETTIDKLNEAYEKDKRRRDAYNNYQEELVDI